MTSGRWLLHGAAAAAGFERRVLVLPPGGRHPYHPSEWRDAIVSVERGEIQLECARQAPRRFRRGHLLWLGGLGLSAICNRGPQPAVLIAVRRRRQRPTRT